MGYLVSETAQQSAGHFDEEAPYFAVAGYCAGATLFGNLVVGQFESKHGLSVRRARDGEGR